MALICPKGEKGEKGVRIPVIIEIESERESKEEKFLMKSNVTISSEISLLLETGINSEKITELRNKGIVRISYSLEN